MKNIVLEEFFKAANVPFNPNEWTPSEQAAAGMYILIVTVLTENGCPEEAIKAMTQAFYNEDGTAKTDVPPEVLSMQIMTALLENGCPEEALSKLGEEMASGLI